jgi:cytochrome c-type biogenesis protein
VETVFVEFIYYEPCPTCPSQQLAYEIYLHNSEVVDWVEATYGSEVWVNRLYFYSGEVLDMLYDEYGMMPGEDEEYWNLIVINREVVIKGYADATSVKEVLDAHLTPVRDISILNVINNQTSIFSGDPVSINVVVKNEGSELESFNVTLYYNSSVLKTHLVNDLEPGSETDFSVHWNTQDIPEGVYVIKAVADTLQDETDVEDNWGTGGFLEVRAPSAPPTIRHDIAITDIEVATTLVGVGEEVNITVYARNLGTERESFEVALYCDGSLIDTKVVTDLDPNFIAYIAFSWNTSDQAPGEYTLKALAELNEEDANSGDNEYVYENEVEVTQSTLPSPMSSFAILALAFSFGFFETFSPCLLILLSFVLSYALSEKPRFKESFARVNVFGIGFVFAASILGLAFGLFFLSMPTLQFYLTWIVCIFAFIFGLNLVGLLKVPLQTKPLMKELASKYILSYSGLFFIGFIFYFLDPCIAPILIAMMPLLSSGQLLLVVLVFSIGAIIPFLGVGIFAGSLSRLVRSTYRQRFKIRALSGLILLGYATYLIATYLIPHMLR